MEFVLKIIYQIKGRAYVINFAEHFAVETHWLALYVNNKILTYFDSFGVKHFPREIKKIIKGTIDNKNIKANIFRIQTYDSIMCGYFCIGFINFMFKGINLTDFTNLFPPDNSKIKTMI